MIYFIQRTDDMRIKIGWTDQTAGKRLKDLWWLTKKTPLQGLGLCYGGPVEEMQLHDRFRRFETDGEWFLPGDDLMDFIRKECDPWDGHACDRRGAPMDPYGGSRNHVIRLDAEEASHVQQVSKAAGLPRTRLLRRAFLYWRAFDPDGAMVKNWAWHERWQETGERPNTPCPMSQVSDQ